MGDNLRIRKLQDDLVKTLNESNLPLELLLLVIEKLHIEIKQKADLAVLQELEALKEVANDKRDDSDNSVENKES
ncbi:MAG: hypothetical protein IKW90_01675 [Lachnospiraceae bacterium]|nr:hypothetical protein [Lachnospiraceae bacterium]